MPTWLHFPAKMVPRWCQERLWTPPGAPRRRPRRPQMPQDAPRSRPRCAQEPSRMPPRAPRCRQRAQEMQPQRCPEAQGSILEARNRPRDAQTPSRPRFSTIFAWIFINFCCNLAVNLLQWRRAQEMQSQSYPEAQDSILGTRSCLRVAQTASRLRFCTISAKISTDFLQNLLVNLLHCRHHLLFSLQGCLPKVLRAGGVRRRRWQ